MSNLVVVKDTLDILKRTLPYIELEHPPRETVKCIRCGTPMEIPHMIRESDVKRVDELITMIKQYLDEKGVLDELLNQLLIKLKKRLRIH